MSARRVGWLLAAALAVIVFAIWLSSRRHLERDMSVGALVLPGLEHNVNTVSRASLRKGDGTRTTLQKDGDTWRVAERGWPADVGKVRKLLLDLGALNIVEEKTRLPANYPQLGVEDVSSPKASGTLVEIGSPTHSWAVIIGKSSGAKSGYVRVANAPQTLLAAPLLSVDSDPKSWLERTVLDIPVARVRQVEEHPAQGAPFTVAREKKEQNDFTVTPIPKGRELLNAAAAEPITTALASLTLEDVHKADPKNGSPSARALYRTFDGLEVEVSGRKEGTHSLIALSAHSTSPDTSAEAERLNARLAGWELEVPDYKYSAIFSPLEELLKKPPQPAKKAAARPAGPAKGATKPAAAIPAPGTVPSK
ncbi:MAG: DUF4340 domain-containing protein [Gammaproteobacteria bacterium]|nr:DUF4340 domain-containing protein [Gammaproteobacteria bacterium]